MHGFLPGRRHRRYYRTSSSSFPGPYSVPPVVTSITLEKASEARKRSVSLLASQASSLETMLSGVCEVSSWVDWWPCGVVVACLLHTQEVPGSIPGRGSYLRQVSLH